LTVPFQKPGLGISERSSSDVLSYRLLYSSTKSRSYGMATSTLSHSTMLSKAKVEVDQSDGDNAIREYTLSSFCTQIFSNKRGQEMHILNTFDDENNLAKDHLGNVKFNPVHTKDC
jgi:hypothetical protein